jgi:hypothetical protein
VEHECLHPVLASRRTDRLCRWTAQELAELRWAGTALGAGLDQSAAEASKDLGVTFDELHLDLSPRRGIVLGISE